MKSGTVLVDPVSGLRLMVVDAGLPAFDTKPEDVVVQDRPLSEEVLVPAGRNYTNVSITTDPGDRHKG